MDEVKARELGGREIAAIRRVLDRQEIHDVLLRYCRGVDRSDNDLIRASFHPDATQNQRGQETPVSVLFDRLDRPVRQAFKSIAHYVSNALIEVEDDVAFCESYFLACHRFEHSSVDFDWIVGGRYVDRFERREEVWRIAHRVAIYDWVRVDQVEDRPADLTLVQGIDDGLWGRRDRSDASYTRA